MTAALAGCGSGEGRPDRSETTLPGARQLTTAEATLLAGALFENYDRGGASFQATAQFRTSGDSIELEGAIDWRNHIGAAQVVAVGAEADLTEVLWTTSEVLESRVGLAEQLAADGYPGARFISRAPAPERRQVDGLLALVMGLAAEQRDNPLLLQQGDAARRLRDDVVTSGGTDTPVTVFGFGTFELWVDADGVIRRYSGSTSDGNRVTTIDFFDHGPVEITGPPAAEVAPGP